MENRPTYCNYSFTLRSSFIFEFDLGVSIVPFRLIHFIDASLLHIVLPPFGRCAGANWSELLDHLKTFESSSFSGFSLLVYVMCIYHFVLSRCRRFSTPLILDLCSHFFSQCVVEISFPWSNCPYQLVCRGAYGQGAKFRSLIGIDLVLLQFKLLVYWWSVHNVNWVWPETYAYIWDELYRLPFASYV